MTNQHFFIKKLVAYRELKKVNQKDLAKAMGFKDRQTLSSIETGSRELKPEELMKALSHLNLSLQEFSDPYSLVGEANYSWRQCDASEDELTTYENKTSKVIALLRDLDSKFSTTEHSVILPKLPLTKNSTFTDAKNCAEQLVKEFKLGDFPIETLEDRFFNKFNVSKLYMDMPQCVSGAAIKLDNISVILINRNEVPGRRNFDMAHEAFHCLTWDAIPPQHVEKAYQAGVSKPHTEKLADAFASSLLMPKDSIEKYFHITDSELTEDILNSLSKKFGVSSTALMWRLKALNKVSQKTVDRMNKDLLVNNGKAVHLNKKPKLFNIPFVNYMYKAIDSGTLSVRKLLSIVGMTMEELSELFESYDLAVPYDL